MNAVFIFFSGLAAIVFFVLIVGAAFGLGAFFGYTVLKPLIRATEGRKTKLRFYTSDFFSLTLVLALPALFISSLQKTAMPQGILIFMSILMFAIAIWAWVRSAMKLSAMDVTSGLKRFVFLAALVPVAMLGSAAVPVLVGHVVSTLVNQQVAEFLIAACGAAGTVLIALFGKILCRWVIRKDGESTTTGTIEQLDDLFSTANDELKGGSLPFDD